MRRFAPGLYAEAGAMRIPRVHDLTLAYCDLFGLELRPFVMGNPKALVHIDGQRMTVEEADAPAGASAVRAGRPREGQDLDELWNEATREFREKLRGQGRRLGRRSSRLRTTSTRSASSW